MATKRVTLLELDIDNSQVLKKRADNLKQIEKLKKAQKDLKKETDNLTSATDSEAKAYASNEAELKKLQAEGRIYTRALQDQSKAQQDNLNVVKQTDGSINSLRNALNVNKATYQSLTKEQRENEAVGGKLKQTINEQDAEYKELSKSIGNNQVEVGNYKLATEELTSSLNIMGVNVGQVANNLKAKKSALNATRASLSGTTKGLKLFRIALIATGIGAIVVLLGALASAFASTQKGADAISKALAPVKGFFSAIVATLQNTAIPTFKLLGNTFTIFKNGFLVGLKLIQLAWAKVFGTDEEVAELSGELKQLNKETLEAGEAILQNGKDIATSFSGVGDRIDENIKRQKEIVRLGIEAEELAIANVYAQGRLSNEIKAQNKIAEDTTRPLKERELATIRSIEASKELLKSEQDLLRVKIEQVKAQQSQTDTSREDLLELANLEKEFADKETQALELQTTQTNKLNTIRREAESKRKKAQDERRKALEDELALAQTIANQNLTLLSQELDAYLLNNKSKLNNQKLLSKESINEEVKRLRSIKDRQSEVNKETLNANLQALKDELRLKNITQAEYDNEVKIARNELQLQELASTQEFNQAKLDLEKQFLEQQEQARIDAEQIANDKRIEERANKILRLQLEGAEESLIRQAQLDEQIRQELEQAEKIGADKALILAKYADREVAINEAKENAKLQASAQILGQLKGLLEEGSDAYKALAIAETTISTYLGAQKAYVSQLIPGDPSSPIRATIASGIAVASGLLNVRKIAGFAEGSTNVQDLTNHTGIITGTPNIRRSNGDNMLATVRTGEAILNNSQQQRINELVGFDAIRYAVKGYANGTTSTTDKVIASNVINDSGLTTQPTVYNQVIDIKDLVRESNNYTDNIDDGSI